MKFNEMNLIEPIIKAVEKAGYTNPTPIQERAIPDLLNGFDLLGCAQTGTGKTAAFALPILQHIANKAVNKGEVRPIRALILTPTRELAIQIYDNFRLYGEYLTLKTAVIFGGVSQIPQVETLKAGVDILVATPGRLNDLIGQGYIRLDGIEIFVLDEADRMLDMGFIHDVKKVIAKLPEKRQTLLFSATMPEEVEKLALGILKNPKTVKVNPVTSTVDAIKQSLYYVDKANKTKLLMYILEKTGAYSALVFTRTKHGANKVVKELESEKIEVMAIHGNKSQTARQKALGDFKSGKLRVLVATDIAARGIDIAELPLVVNYDIPEEAETYIHRIGRTGRAGMDGMSVSFCCIDELQLIKAVEKLTGKSIPLADCPYPMVNLVPKPKAVKTGRASASLQQERSAPSREKKQTRSAGQISPMHGGEKKTAGMQKAPEGGRRPGGQQSSFTASQKAPVSEDRKNEQNGKVTQPEQARVTGRRPAAPAVKNHNRPIEKLHTDFTDRFGSTGRVGGNNKKNK